ncbi:MAG: hypothetical protein LC114_26785 [Bryobacterales bacterium]|nr:hypothetical protein [Bryobacterales bacterium]
MKSLLHLITILPLTAFGQPGEAARFCIDPAFPQGDSWSSISLQTNIDHPFFYYRPHDFRLVVVMSSKTVLGLLEEAVAAHNRDAKSLLQSVENDLPLTENTDLLRYVLLDFDLLYFVEQLMVESLARGEAEIIDLGTGIPETSIEMKRGNYEYSRSRTFYSSYKDILILSQDCTVG